MSWGSIGGSRFVADATPDRWLTCSFGGSSTAVQVEYFSSTDARG